MISEYKLYHGAVLADIVDRAEHPVAFQELSESGRLLNYIINGCVGMQVKFATQRLRPWPFSFTTQQISSLIELKAKCERTFIVLVCHKDGIISADIEDVLPSLLAAGENGAWLKANRKKHEMYRLSGPLGELPKRFSVTTDPIVEALELAG